MRRGLFISFFAILAMSVCFQLWRMSQADAAAWLSVDYLMRATALIALAVARPTRHLAFKTRPLQIGKAELAAWFLGAATLAALYGYEPPWHVVEAWSPDIRLDFPPRTRGVLHFIDLTFGLALVAIHEEIFFRRVARAVLRPLGDGVAMIAISSVIFGLFHWWTGLPNIVLATVTGAFLMLLYRRAGALWPAVLAHYLIDFWILL
ncbi:MAG TPA: CPBP family intramembrane glutamic endopeptidase [Dongiaceae bacterium]|nr:CPBP family intramembrane glutamic endopeptidase [Dongiaceae bacterium]